MTNSVQNFQIAVFTQSASTLNAEDLFTTIYQESPSSTQKQKYPQPNAPFLSAAFGDKDGAAYSAQVNEGRVDFHLSAINEAGEDIKIGNISPDWAMRYFVDNYRDITPQLGQVYRLAIVTNSVNLFLNQTDAVSAFCNSTGIPAPGDDATAADLIFQMNRRAKIESIEVNKLFRCSIEQYAFALGNLSNPMLNLIPAPAMKKMNQYLALNTMKDVNTVPTSTPLAGDMQFDILKHLFDMRGDF